MDNLSGGRVGLSLASGWHPDDFLLAPGNHAERRDLLFRNAELVRRLWRGEALEFPGPDGKPVEVRTLPRPVQPELPLWITTAGNVETYREAGTLGARVLTHLLGQTMEEVEERVAAYHAAWREAGNEGRGHVSLMLHTFVGTDVDEVREVVREPMKAYLRTSVGLIRNVADAWTAYRRKPGAPPVARGDEFTNLPEEDLAGGDGPASSEQRERREETTNYELNSKRIATVSNGYSVSRLSIAVVVNRERLAAVLGAEATPERIAERIAEIEKLVSSAAGFDTARGDVINVSSVEFIDGIAGVEMAEPGMFESIGRHAGTMINALAFVVVVFLVSWFGLRPLVAAVAGKKEEDGEMNFGDIQLSLPNPLDAMQLPDPLAADGEAMNPFGGPFPDHMADDIRFKIKPAPQDRLAQMVDLNEERSALILRKWAAQEAAA